MTDLAVSRRAVTRLLATLPLIAVPAAGRAVAASEGDYAMNMHRTIMSTKTAGDWRSLVDRYLETRREWNRANDIYSAADEARTLYTEPKPQKPVSYAKRHGIDIGTLTINEICDLPTDEDAWAEYERAEKAWKEASDQWEERQMAEANRIWSDALEAVCAAGMAVVRCSVSTIQNLAEKIALAEQLLGEYDGDLVGYEDAKQVYFSTLRADSAAIAGRA